MFLEDTQIWRLQYVSRLICCNMHLESELADAGVLPQLNDPSLFKDKTYVNGEWIGAKSGKTFEVHGTTMLSSKTHRLRHV